jgi:hypothetical protein
MHLHFQDRFYRLAIYFIYFFAVLFLIYLVSSVRPDVFFSGDGGVKFIVVKQLATGAGSKSIYLPHPEWVKAIWNKGYFPINKPFVYPSPEGYIISFPPAFQIVSSIFYKKFGYLGLYIIPFLSTLFIWAWFIYLLRKISTPPKLILLAFFVLVFCSPLTFYGAAFWEHMPAVLLLFAGVVFIVNHPKKNWQGFALGCMCGLAAWLRPEAILINVFFAVATLFSNRKKRAQVNWFFMAGTALGVSSFFVFNLVTYGALLGAHGQQLFEGDTLVANFKIVARNYIFLKFFLIKYFSASLLLLFVLYGWLKRKWKLSDQAKFMLLISVSFLVFSPLLLPNIGGKQWGPRYYLPVMPMVIILFVFVFREWQEILSHRNQIQLRVVILVILLYSFFLNTFKEANSVADDNHNRILPALNFIKSQPENEIVVNSDFVTMELGAMFMKKNFFLAADTGSITKLIPMLKQHGVHSFIYVNYSEEPPGLSELLKGYHAALINKGMYTVARFEFY